MLICYTLSKLLLTYVTFNCVHFKIDLESRHTCMSHLRSPTSVAISCQYIATEHILASSCLEFLYRFFFVDWYIIGLFSHIRSLSRNPFSPNEYSSIYQPSSLVSLLKLLGWHNLPCGCRMMPCSIVQQTAAEIEPSSISCYCAVWMLL